MTLNAYDFPEISEEKQDIVEVELTRAIKNNCISFWEHQKLM